MKKMIFIAIFLILSTFVTSAQQTSDKYQKSIQSADTQYFQQNYVNAAILYEKAFAANNNSGMVRDRIKAACCYSQLKKNDSAFFHLNRIVKFGFYYDYTKLLEEKKLSNLHQDVRWKQLIEMMKEEDDKLKEMTN